MMNKKLNKIILLVILILLNACNKKSVPINIIDYYVTLDRKDLPCFQKNFINFCVTTNDVKLFSVQMQEISTLPITRRYDEQYLIKYQTNSDWIGLITFYNKYNTNKINMYIMGAIDLINNLKIDLSEKCKSIVFTKSTNDFDINLYIIDKDAQNR